MLECHWSDIGKSWGAFKTLPDLAALYHTSDWTFRHFLDAGCDMLESSYKVEKREPLETGSKMSEYLMLLLCYWVIMYLYIYSCDISETAWLNVFLAMLIDHDINGHLLKPL